MPNIHKQHCQQKRAYDNEPLARAVGEHQCALSDKYRGTKRKLYVYRCPICNRYHLTSCWQRTPAIIAGDPYFIKQTG